MADPTGRFRLIPQDTTVVAVDDTVVRLADIASQSIVSTGIGNEVDFGTVSISAGAANSGVKTILWDVTANGGNTTVSAFKLWLSDNGFDIAASVEKVQPLSGADQAAPANTENYIVNGVVGSYTWATADEAEPGAQNVWPSDEGASMDISGGASDDVIMWAWYLAIGALETLGTYKGTDAGFELQHTLMFSYS